MAEGGTTLEYTPTWVVALVSSVIVILSLFLERTLHYTGKYLKKHNQKPLFQALQKIKEELMLLGFISLLLTVFQGRIAKICITEKHAGQWLPCKKETTSTSTSAHFQTVFFPWSSAARRLLAEDSASTTSGSCSEGKVPLLSTTALHHLHIFIFVLAVVHVTFCVLTILFGGAKIRQWKHWEDSITKKEYNPQEVLTMKFTHVHDHDFIRGRFRGIGKNSVILGWLHAFFKQFYGSVTKTDYMTMRLGFISTHCKTNPNFNFHKYMIRALEADFKRVVGISWYLWIFVVIFLLLNVSGWHAYFWIAFIPFILLLAVGTKLEHVISQLAHEVAEKHIAIEGDLVVQPSDDHFWFHRPRLVLLLVHIILFQNSFELAFFFWILVTFFFKIIKLKVKMLVLVDYFLIFLIWCFNLLQVQYKFHSCMMGELGYVIPRLVIGVFVQFVCSYSTLPLYAIVTQMGSSFKKAIFEEHIQEGLVGWARSAKKNKALRNAANANGSGSGAGAGSTQVGVGVGLKEKEKEASVTLELAQKLKVGNKEGSSLQRHDTTSTGAAAAVTAGEIEPQQPLIQQSKLQ